MKGSEPVLQSIPLLQAAAAWHVERRARKAEAPQQRLQASQEASGEEDEEEEA